jgi:hypothetical protein
MRILPAKFYFVDIWRISTTRKFSIRFKRNSISLSPPAQHTDVPASQILMGQTGKCGMLSSVCHSPSHFLRFTPRGGPGEELCIQAKEDKSRAEKL